MSTVLSPSKKDSVTEISLTGRGLRSQEKRAAHTFFEGCRIPLKDLVGSDYKGIFRLSCYPRSPKQVREILKKYKMLKSPPCALKIKTLQRHDWFDKWKLDYHIRPLGTKFMIVPAWEKSKFKPHGRIPISLEPGSAFGSGYHETTRLMTRLLESLEGKMESFLDIGTGTGILSVAASKLGAKKITGFDNDRPSALVAEKNFRANGCDGGTFFRAQLKSSKIPGSFDVVGANLLSKTLLEHRAKMIARVRPGGALLVSGIDRQNFNAFKRGFSGAGLKRLKVLRGRRWVAVLYKRGL